MRISKVFSIILLVSFLCSVIPFNTNYSFPTTNLHTRALTMPSDPPLPTPGPGPHILVYTEFADNSAGGEVENTLDAITNTYGSDYTWTNLTDYNDLDDLIWRHDILLIPEQENALYAEMTAVGTAWATTLDTFIDKGGIVISCDGRSIPEGAGSRAINARLTSAAGLFLFSVAYLPSGTITKVDTSDPLGQGTTATWSTASMTVSYDAVVINVVASIGDTVVAHDYFGKGHFVQIGFDFWTTGTEFEIILANAIRLHRHIVFDDSHGNNYEIGQELSSFRDDLLAEGFAVSQMDTFSSAYLNASDVLVICYPTSWYVTGERGIIKNFVEQGGSLYLIGDWGSLAYYQDMIADEFGFGFELDSVIFQDTDDYTANQNYVIYNESNLQTHPINQGVTRVEFYSSNAIIKKPAEAVDIIVSDNDATSQWSNGTAAPATTMYAALDYQKGRIVISPEMNPLSDFSDSDSDGVDNYHDSDNDVLAINTIKWLAENRAPVVSVIAPNGGETFEGATNTISWTEAYDPNNDLILGYSVSASPDNGSSWFTIATNLINTSINWDVAGSPESGRYLIRVQAMDYGVIGEDTSDSIFAVESEGPAITDVVHLPTPPDANVPVTIRANVTDVTGVASVTCTFSSDGGSIWANTTMTHTSGNTYEATIGPFAGGTVVEYKIIATDTTSEHKVTITSTYTFTVLAGTPPIPGFPFEAIALGLLLSVSAIFVFRRRQNNR